jgi:hypothetical protein
MTGLAPATILAMIPDLPFLLSTAALSASLAGLAGLVAGLHRGEGLTALDRFRLREIVEFAFANTLLAMAILPLASILGSVENAARAVAVTAIVYLALITVVLARRMRAAGIAMTTWLWIAGALDLLILAAALATIAGGALAALQVMLLLLLARPMTAFLFVLASFDTPSGPGTAARR